MAFSSFIHTFSRVGHTYTNLLTHIIFSTKDRLPYLRDDHRDDVFVYIGLCAS